MIIKVKGNKGKCPHCGKWVKLVYNDHMNQKELHCCRVYGIHGEIKNAKKSKRK
jgi:hypothetical protein